MDRKGAGHAHDMLIAVFVLILALTFYAGSYKIAIPPFLVIFGGVMVLGGLIWREPMMVTGGIVIFAVALIYAETVV